MNKDKIAELENALDYLVAYGQECIKNEPNLSLIHI